MVPQKVYVLHPCHWKCYAPYDEWHCLFHATPTKTNHTVNHFLNYPSYNSNAKIVYLTRYLIWSLCLDSNSIFLLYPQVFSWTGGYPTIHHTSIVFNGPIFQIHCQYLPECPSGNFNLLSMKQAMSNLLGCVYWHGCLAIQITHVYEYIDHTARAWMFQRRDRNNTRQWSLLWQNGNVTQRSLSSEFMHKSEVLRNDLI